MVYTVLNPNLKRPRGGSTLLPSNGRKSLLLNPIFILTQFLLSCIIISRNREHPKNTYCILVWSSTRYKIFLAIFQSSYVLISFVFVGELQYLCSELLFENKHFEGVFIIRVTRHKSTGIPWLVRKVKVVNLSDFVEGTFTSHHL